LLFACPCRKLLRAGCFWLYWLYK